MSGGGAGPAGASAPTDSRPAAAALRVAVLFGGPSREREVSRASGRAVEAALTQRGHLVLPVEITHTGRWCIEGAAPAALPGETPETALAQLSGTDAAPDPMRGTGRVDVVFVAMHGAFGEDGTVQGLLECSGLPYTGSGVAASALAMDKVRTKEVLSHHGIRTAPWLVVTPARFAREADLVLDEIESGLGLPVVVKPPRDGSSFGLSLASSRAGLRRDLAALIADAGGSALVEQRLVGTEVSCPVLGNHGGPLRALPVIEIVPRDGGLFDFAAKYEGSSDEICPARLDEDVAERVRRASCVAHEVLGCDGVSRSDFIVDASGEPWFLETNTIPGMTPQSLCPLSARAAGWSFEEFCGVLVDLAIARQSPR